MLVFLLGNWLFFMIIHLSMAQPTSRPNIVILLADDLGIGDVGCYGNTTLHTPNIDSLARDGMKLTQHLAADSMCTPSRSALLTGRYPKRYGMDGGFVRVLYVLASPAALPTTEVTFAQQAQTAGYKTALIGKWHQGLFDIYRSPVHHPNNRGFDFFYGLPLSLSKDFSDEASSIWILTFPNLGRNLVMLDTITLASIILAYQLGIIRKRGLFLLCILFIIFLIYSYVSVYMLRIWNAVLMRNLDVVEMPVRLVGLTRRLATEGAEFIKNQTELGNAFLLLMSWGHVHTSLAPSKKFSGHTRHGRYGDCVEELDWGIGVILQALRNAGVENDTLVYFTSDHGGSLHDTGPNGQVDGGFNGIYKGGKGQGGIDGGIRVPGVFRWPGIIKPSSVSNIVTSQMDIFPLVSKLTGVPLPTNTEIDGKDIFQVLEGTTQSSPHTFLFHYCDGDIHAVRYTPRAETVVWKLAYRFPNFLKNSSLSTEECNCKQALHLHTPYLFNITSDPGENFPVNLNSDPKYGKIVAAIDTATKDHVTSIPEVKGRLGFLNVIWYPHLQPCCNFPYCSCSEYKYKDIDLQ